MKANDQATAPPTPDLGEMERHLLALRVLPQRDVDGPADKQEIRTLLPREGGGTRPGISITSASPKALAKIALAENQKGRNVYVCSGALAESHRDEKGKSVSDGQVVRVLAILVDFDTVRAHPDKVPATDEEAERTLAHALSVAGELERRGFPRPLVVFSGNGAQLQYLIGWEVTPESKGLVKRFLAAVGTRFPSDWCEVDRKTYNPSRLMRLAGSVNYKPEPTAERRNRLARLVEVPEAGRLLTMDVVRAFVEGVEGASRPETLRTPGGAIVHIDGHTNGHAKNGYAKNGQKRKGLIARAVEPGDPMNRPIAYLAECEPAVSGEGGHNTTLRVMCSLGPGFDLSEETCFDLAWAHWNPRCQPPWSEKDLRRKVAEAYKREKDRGWLLDENPSRNGTRRGEAGAGEVDGGGQCEDERPEILVSTDIHVTIEAAVEALAGEEDLFQRGNVLVTILRAPEGKEGRVEYREAGSPRINPAPVPRVGEFLSRNARFVKWDGRAKAPVPTRVPSWCAEAVAVRGHWPAVRSIEGVVEAPTIRPDGSLLDRPGYDPATGLVHLPGGEFPAIPEAPSQAEAATAADLLFDLIADFPLAGPEHKAAWLSGLLTVVGRFAILGPCPMFLVDGNVSGAGKSWLCDLVAIIATGREMPRSSYRDDEAEMGKAILSIALAGVRLVLFDNIPTGFKVGSGALDRALTGRTFQDRLLGKHQMSPETPLDAVFFASGNNLGLKGDALRRIIPIRLDSPHERPEERDDYRVGNIKGHARERRGVLLAAALTILRAHAVAGRPRSDLPRMSYPEWSEVIRDAVHWATGLDPAAPRIAVREEDTETQARNTLIQGWARLTRISGKPMSAAAALRLLKDNAEAHRQLHDLLCGWSEDGGLPTTRRLGNALARERQRPTPHGCLEFKTLDGNRVWFIKPTRQSGSVAPSGSSTILPDHEMQRETGADACKSGVGDRDAESLGATEPLSGPCDPRLREALARELKAGPVGEVVASMLAGNAAHSWWPEVMPEFPIESAVASRLRQIEYIRRAVLEPEPPHGLGGYAKAYKGMRGTATFFVLPEHEAAGLWPPSTSAYAEALEAARETLPDLERAIGDEAGGGGPAF